MTIDGGLGGSGSCGGDGGSGGCGGNDVLLTHARSPCRMPSAGQPGGFTRTSSLKTTNLVKTVIKKRSLIVQPYAPTDPKKKFRRKVPIESRKQCSGLKSIILVLLYNKAIKKYEFNSKSFYTVYCTVFVVQLGLVFLLFLQNYRLIKKNLQTTG